ncbi:cytochrome o ubiquinol oxidase subunit IV [Palleronia caenipelagi]|uniref:Cytochrome bo(3) ubiquinol oxidase subunit 4 n=1 Tax=Palleronia caenipelagi TaxID=2489174 RepID=A0A547Q7R4_9RHOB|nr:cytochrome o ubiquinol oxidase subunit IV [Palleronia caenipelagi]TRD22401.1 cytochrome o ubiquinol oxidase subunit IV [Palleronia caenipelagi]
MSASDLSHDHGHELGAQMPHGSKKSYVTGFVLSVILTVIPFGVVMAGGFASAQMTGILVLACAVVQMVVHIIYFLHMSPKAQQGWVLSAMAFTIIVLVIAVVGTIWVMLNMDSYMMPGMDGGRLSDG